MIKLVNLTPHAIVLRNPLGVDTVIPPSGNVARCASTPGYVSEKCYSFPCLVVSATTYGDVTGLPEYEPGGCYECGHPRDNHDTYCEAWDSRIGEEAYIVSAMVLNHPSVKGRPDVFGPGTGSNDGAIRDTEGRIIAVTRLVRA